MTAVVHHGDFDGCIMFLSGVQVTWYKLLLYHHHGSDVQGLSELLLCCVPAVHDMGGSTGCAYVICTTAAAVSSSKYCTRYHTRYLVNFLFGYRC